MHRGAISLPWIAGVCESRRRKKKEKEKRMGSRIEKKGYIAICQHPISKTSRREKKRLKKIISRCCRRGGIGCMPCTLPPWVILSRVSGGRSRRHAGRPAGKASGRGLGEESQQGRAVPSELMQEEVVLLQKGCVCVGVCGGGWKVWCFILFYYLFWSFFWSFFDAEHVRLLFCSVALKNC